jgi:hypothetical protein
MFNASRRFYRIRHLLLVMFLIKLAHILENTYLFVLQMCLGVSEVRLNESKSIVSGWLKVDTTALVIPACQHSTDQTITSQPNYNSLSFGSIFSSAHMIYRHDSGSRSSLFWKRVHHLNVSSVSIRRDNFCCTTYLFHPASASLYWSKLSLRMVHLFIAKRRRHWRPSHGGIAIVWWGGNASTKCWRRTLYTGGGCKYIQAELKPSTVWYEQCSWADYKHY